MTLELFLLKLIAVQRPVYARRTDALSYAALG